jgi:phosphoglycolate phosphatase-like HAD superfamily hydrolase
MIKGVMFDMGGTLEDLYFDDSNIRRTSHALYEILQKHGIEVPYGEDELWNLVYRNPPLQGKKRKSRSWNSSPSRSGRTMDFAKFL